MVESEEFTPSLGAIVTDEGVHFTLWSPASERPELLIEDNGTALPLERHGPGFHSLLVAGSKAGARYRYRLGEHTFPDPASRYQPEGVHGPSQVVDPATYSWLNPWPARTEGGAIYELHLGTFTPGWAGRGHHRTHACTRLPWPLELGLRSRFSVRSLPCLRHTRPTPLSGR